MIQFVVGNLATIVVATIVFILCFLVIQKMIKDRKKQSGSCASGCGGCPVKGICSAGKMKNPPGKVTLL
jgi:hypothetical protein